MAQDFITLGPSPSEESCVMVGSPDYRTRALRECACYTHLIREALGPEPEGARLRTKGFPHDFGTYYEVVCEFDEDKPDSIHYAFRCEAEAPQNWTDAIHPSAAGEKERTESTTAS